ncbi:MAG: hypothetical protein ACR2FN_01275 [Chitinophagaceae bacterium]
MKKYIFFCFSFFITLKICAQTPDDALRNAWFIPGGTARNTAIGGVMGSLGGDITANNVNPAGIGLYKTNEWVLSPGFLFNSNKINYRDSNSSNNKSAFAYGASGVIFGSAGRNGSKWTSHAVSISINQLASFNNHIYYKGFNNVSSFSEQYLEELTRDNADTISALQNYIFGSSLAFRTYLIDTLNNENGEFIGYKSLVPISTGIIQERDETTKGGYHEISLAFAGNMEDKLYMGASVNVPVVSYERDLLYKESDATNNPDNNFSYSQYTENFKSTGIGLNVKLGLIYKLQDFLRIGFAIHTPSYIFFKDEIRSAMITNTENYAGTISENSDNLNSGNAGERNYNLLTPWRAIASASYVFREVANTKQQRAFISADLEYVNYRAARFYSADNTDQSSNDFYAALNSTVKDYYKPALNFRLGGELKFDPCAFRLGAAYYGSPYSDAQLKANRTQFSGGLGYRAHGFFIDLTYAYTANKDVNFPYRLNDKANTFADVKNNRGDLIFTVGCKF